MRIDVEKVNMRPSAYSEDPIAGKEIRASVRELIEAEGAAAEIQHWPFALEPPAESGRDEILAPRADRTEIHDAGPAQDAQVLGGVVLGNLKPLREFVHA